MYRQCIFIYDVVTLTMFVSVIGIVLNVAMEIFYTTSP